MLAVGVLLNHRHRRIQYRLRAAIVLLQRNRLQVGKVLAQAQHVAVICATPRVHTLIHITDRKNIFVLAHDEFYQLILRHVGVLKFIHQHMRVALLQFLAHRLVAAQQIHRLGHQVVKVQRVVGVQHLLIALIHALHNLVVVAARLKFFGRNQFVFGVADGAVNAAGFVFLVIQV